MCTSPRYILNNSKDGNINYARRWRVVPCGHCEECREKDRKAWYLRTSRMMHEFVDANGIVLFVTLTYKESALPFIIDDYGRKITGFSSKHKDTFLNSLRAWLRREYGLSDNFKYLWCCEYGGQKTKRPHYHCLFFIPHLSVFDNVKECKDFLYNLKNAIEDKFWHHGFVGFTLKGNDNWKPHIKGVLSKADESFWLHDVVEKYGSGIGKHHRYNLSMMCVSNDSGVKYVSKYCCKDVNTYNREDVKRYLHPTESDLIQYNSFNDVALSLEDLKEKHKEQFKEIAPRHWQSHSFATNMINEIEEMDESKQMNYLLNGIPFVNKSDGSVLFYKLPAYFVYKLTHNFGDNYIELSDIGKKYYLERFDSDIEHNTYYISKVFDYSFIKNYVSDTCLSKFGYPSVASFCVSHYPLDYGLFYLYCQLWRDLFIPKSDLGLMNTIISSQGVYNISKTIYMYDKNVFSGLDEDVPKFIDTIDFNDFISCRYLDIFDGFENLYNCYITLSNEMRENISKYKVSKNMKCEMLKSLFYYHNVS